MDKVKRNDLLIKFFGLPSWRLESIAPTTIVDGTSARNGREMYRARIGKRPFFYGTTVYDSIVAAMENGRQNDKIIAVSAALEAANNGTARS